jgi:hypothetical protein
MVVDIKAKTSVLRKLSKLLALYKCITLWKLELEGGKKGLGDR